MIRGLMLFFAFVVFMTAYAVDERLAKAMTVPYAMVLIISVVVGELQDKRER